MLDDIKNAFLRLKSDTQLVFGQNNDPLDIKNYIGRQNRVFK